MTVLTELRKLGSFLGLQVTPTIDDELVSRPEDFAAGAHALQYHGGPTITDPKLALLWCGTPFVDRVKMEQFAKELMEYGYLTAMTYADFKTGTFLGGFGGPALASGQTVLDSTLRADLEAVLTAYPNLPQPDGRTIYALMIPDGVTVQFDGSSDTNCQSFCGFHEADAAHPQILYTVQPSTNCSGCNQGDPFAAACMVLAHEVAETCSDPDGTGWYEDSTGMENADIVAWIAKAYGPWTVQGYSDPQGNNVLGTYNPVRQPKPPAGTTTSLFLSPNPVEAGSPLAVSVSVSGNAPTGSVSIMAAGVLVDLLPLDATGRASGSLIFKTAGTETLVAVYAGDAQNLSSSSQSTSLVITAAPGPPPGGGNPYKDAAAATLATLQAAAKANPRSASAQLELKGAQLVLAAVDAVP